MIEILPVESAQQLDHVKKLFISYGTWRKHDAALGDFQKELDNLPGKYAFPGGALFIAYFDGEAAGCIGYQSLSPEICEMKRMYVLDAYRNKGIGKQLVVQLMECAKDHGYQIMRLDTHPHMTAAHTLYQGMGFYEIERYNNNPTPGIRFFERKLSQD